MGGGKTTGIAKAILHHDLYEQNCVAVNRGKFLIIEGTLQNLDGGAHPTSILLRDSETQ